MKDLLIASAAVLLILSGVILVYHFYLAPQGRSYDNYQATKPSQENNADVDEQEDATDATQESDGIIEATKGSGPSEQETLVPSKSVATSQEDCSTLTHNCGSCLSKTGCGWCKDTNSCLFGDSNGPKVSSCPDDKWAIATAECSVVDDDFDCYGITNCAECLSGSGCRWCIQGSICAPDSSADSCFGGWMAESYQCSYASR